MLRGAGGGAGGGGMDMGGGGGAGALTSLVVRRSSTMMRLGLRLRISLRGELLLLRVRRVLGPRRTTISSSPRIWLLLLLLRK